MRKSGVRFQKFKYRRLRDCSGQHAHRILLIIHHGTITLQHGLDPVGTVLGEIGANHFIAGKIDDDAPDELTPTESGLYYRILRKSDGRKPQASNSVEVNYKGWLDNGKQFDSSYDRGQPFSFTLGAGQVIKGWDQGVAGMKVGGKRKLVIPADLAYGANSPSPSIPPNSTLVFEVELLGVN